MARKPKSTQDTLIRIQNVERHFGSVTALDSVSLDIRQGEFFSLLGPSGCGKTTLLRMISGFELPDSGSVHIGGEDMSDVPPNLRPTNMVFQSYAIFPHLNVATNVGYGLKRLGLPKDEYNRRIEESLALVDLAGYGERQPHALSGGQRQRVALARALVMQPKVLLLDEPLSALDKKLREAMQSELRRLQRTIGITFVLVTHDQEEALTMSDRIAVMFNGRISQIDTPENLYKQPVNRRVASFIGVMNFLPARVVGAGTGAGWLKLDVDALGGFQVAADTRFSKGDSIQVGIRPEMLTVVFDDEPKPRRYIEASVCDISYYGDMTYYTLRLGSTNHEVTVSMRNTAGRAILGVGQRTRVKWGAESIVPLAD